MSFYEYYAKREKNPLGVWVHRKQAGKLAKLVRSYLPPPGRILEIGPGEGHFLEECIKLGFRYCGVEASKEMAMKLKKGADIQISFVPPIPIKTKSVDACCLFHIVEHMPDPIKADKLIEETKRVIIPNGYLFLACPNYSTWGRDFYDEDYTHNYITTPRRIHQLLLDKGYHIMNIKFFSGPVFGPLRYILLFINRLLYWGWLNRLIMSEIYYRGFITFLECFVIVARLPNKTEIGNEISEFPR